MQSIFRFAALIARTTVPKSIRTSQIYQAVRQAVVPHQFDYDHNYYATDVETAASEAASVMAESIGSYFRPRSVIDVGCGTGALLDQFRERDCNVFGLEYADAGIAFCKKRGLSVRKFNIKRDKFTDEKQFDIAVSFEVAEHLPAKTANRYVELLCQLAKIVVMSAATPGQAGTDHINLQPHSYWVKKFSDRGYDLHEAATKEFSEHWQRSGIADFYFKNVLVFKDGGQPDRETNHRHTST